MKAIDAYYLIRESCLKRPELRFKDWPEVPKNDVLINLRPYTGYCYVATQVFCYLVEEAKPYKFDNPWHYYAMIGDKVWDLTAEQFGRVLDYNIGKPTRFKNALCERSEELYDECCRTY